MIPKAYQNKSPSPPPFKKIYKKSKGGRKLDKKHTSKILLLIFAVSLGSYIKMAEPNSVEHYLYNIYEKTSFNFSVPNLKGLLKYIPFTNFGGQKASAQDNTETAAGAMPSPPLKPGDEGYAGAEEKRKADEAAGKKKNTNESLFPFDDPKASELLKSIVEQKNALDSREKQLKKDTSSLEALRQQIREQIIVLRSLKEEIEKIKKEIDTTLDQQFFSIVRTYSTMKPGKAAEALSRLVKGEKKLAVKIFSQIQPSKLAKIMDKMGAEVSATLTEALANRKKNPLSS